MQDSRTAVIAPGARIVVRDAEWLVRKVDHIIRPTAGGGKDTRVITALGISELVQNKEAVFIEEIERSYGGCREIQILDPADTKLVADQSSGFQKSLLYIESQLRRIAPTGNKLHIGHQAAMDALPFQLDPALQSLQQPRQRILIADAVGLGKTLEAGILVSELIRRGRGRRILVVTTKSMLTQFQKEWWSRFTIPLTRLDSIGIQRIRNRIPTYHNPFHYYDKAIISVDTLKQDIEYRTYIEQAYWDIIVIDEAQHVAERGNSSKRSKLARLLSRKSDTLVLLSATPHDGKPRSFASLMNMLDETAIPNPDEYGPDEIKGLCVRRFKKDVRDQVEKSFPDRHIDQVFATATQSEERAFDYLSRLKFQRLDNNKTAGDLFKTTLEKSLFSSPMACLETIDRRLHRLIDKKDADLQKDISSLEQFKEILSQIDKQSFSKYQTLLTLIKDPTEGFGWNGSDKRDRLVIFTERISTLKFLEEHLLEDLLLSKKQIGLLTGTEMSDIEQQAMVDDFGKEESDIRLLIATDVASEGINLHFFCHRMIHFDIPWSLMIFQQRNGRIDRYGQEHTPQIRYLLTKSNQADIRDDMRILEILTVKDDQAVKNIGDPSEFMRLYDELEEERYVARAIEDRVSPEDFEKTLDENAKKSLKQEFDPLAYLRTAAAPKQESVSVTQCTSLPSLFAGDYEFAKVALTTLKTDRDRDKKDNWQIDFNDQLRLIELTLPDDLSRRFNMLPPEIYPDNEVLRLSSRIDVIARELERARKQDKTWPGIHYLWQLHPAIDWLNEKLAALFRRHEAPVLVTKGVLRKGEAVFIISALIPNRKGQPLLHGWVCLSYINGKFDSSEDFEQFQRRSQLAVGVLPNQQLNVDLEKFRLLLPDAVFRAHEWMKDKRNKFVAEIQPQLHHQLEKLENSRQRHYAQLQIDFAQMNGGQIVGKKESQKRRIDSAINEYEKWIKETMETEPDAFIQIVAGVVDV